VIRRALTSFGEVILLGGRAARAIPRRPLESRSLVHEVYEQGNRALGLLVIMASFAGLVMAFQFGQGLSRFGARQYVGQLTGLAILRELMPVLAALILGGRIVAGIAAELGSMVATEQVDAIRALGADPVKKLVLPRVAATAFVLPAFTILGDLIAMIAAAIVARLEFGVRGAYFYHSLRGFLLVSDFAQGVLKAIVFGAMSALIACREGLSASGGTAGVGRATTSAVVQSSLGVIVADYLVTRLLFAFGIGGFQ
jgi:phospholipid/cholesterol/gamma-HCH transport system permease protein